MGYKADNFLNNSRYDLYKIKITPNESQELLRFSFTANYNYLYKKRKVDLSKQILHLCNMVRFL